MNVDKIYTRKGDSGQTSLYSGERVSKCSARIKLVGRLDTANAQLGLAKFYCNTPFLYDAIENIHLILIKQIMAVVAYNGEYSLEDCDYLGRIQNLYDDVIEKHPNDKITDWTLYGSGTQQEAHLDLATCIIRECEVLFHETQNELAKESFSVVLPSDFSEFFNTLSKVTFLLARLEVV
ncbi:MAG: ATP:cob(I)alamin adenosyltransferase [Opitutales bacterium]|nr:ATP:cob(I)alamin adenosyltransferase [Opitutales bacterium]